MLGTITDIRTIELKEIHILRKIILKYKEFAYISWIVSVLTLKSRLLDVLRAVRKNSMSIPQADLCFSEYPELGKPFMDLVANIEQIESGESELFKLFKPDQELKDIIENIFSPKIDELFQKSPEMEENIINSIKKN